MTDTQTFRVETGPQAGVYCSYCGSKVAPARADNFAITFSCECAYATKEQELRQTITIAEDKLQGLYVSTEVLTKYTKARTLAGVYEALMELELSNVEKAIKELGEIQTSESQINEASS
jgi:hypothetical protein